MKYEYWKSKKNDEWYWRLRADNNKDIIADGGEGYKNKSDCLHGIDLVRSSSDAEAVEVDE